MKPPEEMAPITCTFKVILVTRHPGDEEDTSEALGEYAHKRDAQEHMKRFVSEQPDASEWMRVGSDSFLQLDSKRMVRVEYFITNS